jgi:integrase
METIETEQQQEVFACQSEAWQRCIASFLKEAQDHSGSIDTRRLYASTLKLFLADGRAPDEKTRAQCQDFLESKSTSRRNRGVDVSPSTRNSRLQILNSLYRHASNFEIDGEPIWPSNKAIPTYGIKYIHMEANPRVLSPDDLLRVLDSLPGGPEKVARDRALILCYWWTGKRRTELQRLTWGDLDCDATIVDDDGTRRKGVTFAYISKGKSREIKHAELPRPAWLALEKYLKISGRLEHMQPGAPLFTSSRQKKGEACLCRDYVNKVFKNGCEAAGLDASSLSVHVLRHSGARERYLAGMDLVSLKSWLGHSSLQTTWIYVQGLTSTSDSFALELEKKFSYLAAAQ